MTTSQRDRMDGTPGDGCPTSEDLLCATDGALPRMQQLRVAAHLLRCPACRAQVREWTAIDRIVREEDAAAYVIEPDAPTPSYTVFIERLHAQERALAAQAAPRPRRRWVAAASALSVVTAGALLTRSHVVVAHADELLSRVAAEEAARPAGTVQRIRYQLGPVGIGQPRASDAFAVVREVGHDTGDGAGAGAPAPPPGLGRALADYGFDWQRPLGVASVRRWRANLPRRRDDITTTRDGLVLMRTVASDGELRVVELFVRPDTHHVVRQALVFEGVGRLEIEELATRVVPNAPEPSTPTINAAVASAEVLDLAELEARLVLQRTGVDVDGDVQVSRSRTDIRVEGRVPSAANRQAALAQLVGYEHVRADLRLASLSTPAATSPGRGLAHWLDVAYGERPERERFVADLRRLASRVPRHIAVIQAVALRYPESEGERLSPAARAKLRTLTERHYASLRAEMFALRAQLTAPFGTSPKRPSLARLPSDWRQRSTVAASHAAALERLIADVIVRAEDLRMRSQVNQTFDALWESTVGVRQ